jgi:hypothetical protein
MDMGVDRFGSFYASATFRSTDGHRVPLQFYIHFGIKHDTYKKVFKQKYKNEAKGRIINYLFDFATQCDHTYSESDLQNTRIRNQITNNIITSCNVDGIELINVLNANDATIGSAINIIT